MTNNCCVAVRARLLFPCMNQHPTHKPSDWRWTTIWWWTSRSTFVVSEPIVDSEAVALDHRRGGGGLAARPLPSLSKQPQREHPSFNATQLPCTSCRPTCVSCRRPHGHHQLQIDTSRSTHLLAGECAWLKNTGEDYLVRVLLLKLHPRGMMFALAVCRKSFDGDDIETKLRRSLLIWDRHTSVIARQRLEHPCVVGCNVRCYRPEGKTN